MAYREITRMGYLGRIGESIKGVVFGFVLFLASFILLFWNEGRAVHTARTLEEGKSAVVAVDAGKVDSANEGKLIHFTAKAINAGGEKLVDPIFHVSQDAIHLQRKVWMYQWKEDKKTETRKDAIGGGETKVTTYNYTKSWEDKPIDSSTFKESEQHSNPDHWRVEKYTIDAPTVTAGAFMLDSNLVGMISDFTPVTVSQETVDGLSADLKDDAIYFGNAVYVSNKAGQKPDPDSAVIGNLKVTFEAALPGDVSIIAKQTGSGLAPYQTKNDALEVLHPGKHSAAEMFASEEAKNATLTWIFRLGGFLAMWIGMALMLNPFKVFSDVVGLIGDLVGVGIALVTGVIAVALSFFTIAVAWLAYRPLVGIGLLVVAGGAIAGFFYLRAKSASRRKSIGAAQSAGA